LLASIAPALETLSVAPDVINFHRQRPHGRVRVTLPQATIGKILADKLTSFNLAHPDVILELAVDDSFVDIVAEGYDAGIRLGESVTPGMTAVRVVKDISAAVVAAPDYWSNHAKPRAPHDLADHRCILRRYGIDRGLSPWIFTKDDMRIEVNCTGPLIVNSEAFMRRAALDGVGVAMMAAADVDADIAAGRLERVLEDWCPPNFSFYLYHASHRLPSASLRALIEALRI
jgi:DNA-binding transcriptional LysR family regulator